MAVPLQLYVCIFQNEYATCCFLALVLIGKILLDFCVRASTSWLAVECRLWKTNSLLNRFWVNFISAHCGYLDQWIWIMGFRHNIFQLYLLRIYNIREKDLRHQWKGVWKNTRFVLKKTLSIVLNNTKSIFFFIYSPCVWKNYRCFILEIYWIFLE